MTRTPKMQQILDDLTKGMFGRTNTSAIEGSMCVTCGKPVGEFSDVLSRKEYSISGMCQKCQDSVFGG